MKWYEVYIVHAPGCLTYLARTYNRKEAYQKAQEAADQYGVTVTVKEERGSYRGLYTDYKKVQPQKEVQT